MKHRLIKSVAVTGAAGLICLAASPGYAATIVSQASANALTISIAGNPAGSGTTAATNDGTGETKTGEANPPISVLGGQDLLDIGVLAQDAEATITGQDGTSAACSGIAGDGGGVAEIGESGCLTPGSPVGVSLANLDLTGVVTINPASALGPLAEINPLLNTILDPITSALSAGLEDALGALELGGTLGAVQAFCTASPGTATGTANIVDSKLGLTIAGTSVTLLELPASPPPNTHLVTNLDVVLNTLINAIRTDLNNSLDGLLADVSLLLDPIQEVLVNSIIAQIAPQLAPLEDNILDVTLNKQTVPTAGAIEVTALEVKVLPAAEQFGIGSLIEAQIANVSCGPNGRVGTPRPPTPPLPEIPTVVDSGANGGSNDSGATLAGGLLLIAGAAAAMGYRRRQNV